MRVSFLVTDFVYRYNAGEKKRIKGNPASQRWGLIFSMWKYSTKDWLRRNTLASRNPANIRKPCLLPFFRVSKKTENKINMKIVRALRIILISFDKNRFMVKDPRSNDNVYFTRIMSLNVLKNLILYSFFFKINKQSF